MTNARKGLIGAFLAGGLTLLMMGQGTTPIGSAKELRPWTEGHADAPFCVANGSTPLGCVWLDGGSSIVPTGTVSPKCPFHVLMIDGGLAFDVDCDTSINYNVAPFGNQFAIGPDGSMFFGPFAQSYKNLPDGGSSTLTLASDLSQSLGPAGLPGMEATLPLYNGTKAAHISWDGARWNLDRPSYDSDYFTSDAGFCFNDHTCQTTAASATPRYWDDAGIGDGSIRNLNVGPVRVSSDGTVIAGIKTKNGALGIGSISNHDLYLYTNDGFGFLQGNSSLISLYAPVTMGNRQINSLGAATAATDAAIRNQTILVTDPASGSQLPVMAHGKITLSTGSGNHTFATPFASAPDCTWGDNTAVLSASCSATTTAITCSGTGSDVVSYICVGL